MTDETFKKPPEVVCDDQGIAVRLDGPLRYHIRWSEIRKILIDVIDYGEDGAEAFWVIDGEQPTGSPAFLAPLELVGGGDDLIARLRQMSGFNEAAFQVAKVSPRTLSASHLPPPFATISGDEFRVLTLMYKTCHGNVRLSAALFANIKLWRPNCP